MIMISFFALTVFSFPMPFVNVLSTSPMKVTKALSKPTAAPRKDLVSWNRWAYEKAN
jgi:hypothetical protein